MKRGSLVLLGLLIVFLFSSFVVSVQAQYLFEDGFEHGFTPWSGTVGSPTINQTYVHHGSNSCRADATNNYPYKTVSSLAECYMRFYVRTDALPSGNNEWVGIGQLNSGGSECGSTYIYRATGKNYIHVYTAWGSQDVLFTWAVDTWYCIEIGFLSDANGWCATWIDGVLKNNLTGNTASYAITTCRAPQTSSNIAATTHIDCVVVDTSYIGPEVAGQSFSVNPTVNLDFALSTLPTFYGVYLLSPTVNLVLGLASSLNHITALWSVKPTVNLLFALASTTEIFRTFIQTSGTTLIFSLSSLLTPFLVYVQNPSITLTFSLASSIQRAAIGILHVNPTVILQFSLSTLETAYRMFIQNPSVILNFAVNTLVTPFHIYAASPAVNLVFSLASSVQQVAAGVFHINPTMLLRFSLSTTQTAFLYFTQNPAINLVFNIASSTRHITALWTLNPTIAVQFALSSMRTTFMVFNVNPSVAVQFFVSSAQTLVLHFFQISSAVSLIFQLAASTVIVVPTGIEDVIGLAALALIIALVAVAIAVTESRKG